MSKTKEQRREKDMQRGMPETIEYIERNSAGAIVSQEVVTSFGTNRAVNGRVPPPEVRRVTTNASQRSDLPAIQHRAAPAYGPGYATPARQTPQGNLQRAAGISEALVHRMDPKAPLSDWGRRYRHMSVLEMGRDYLDSAGRSTVGMDRVQLSSELMQFRSGGSGVTSDFVAILSNVATKRLRSAYMEHSPTYQMWAAQAPAATNFKDISVVQLSSAPDLLQTNEHGEFKYGQMSASGETYKLLTFGRILSLTRQAMINDDLGAFGKTISSYAASARRLENRMVYAQLTANAALSDGVPLFHATHANLATGIGSALQASSLQAGRTAMRLQKGLQSELLNLSPRHLIVPSSLEQIAYQLTSDNYVPTKTSDISEFGSRGRTPLAPVVESLLDSVSVAAWYLAAQGGMVDTVEYCYLDGADGPVLQAKDGFEIDETSFRCRLDFAAKAIDHRGLYRGDGL